MKYPSYCYLIKMGDYGKVGLSGWIDHRMQTHKQEYGNTPKIIFKKKLSDRPKARKLEKNLVDLLKRENAIRIGREYFVWDNKLCFLMEAYVENRLKVEEDK